MLWNRVKSSLRESLPPAEFDLWIEPLGPGRDREDCLELLGPDRFFCAYVQDHYMDAILQGLREAGAEGRGVRLAARTAEPPGRRERQNGSRPARLPGMPEVEAVRRSLHPRFLFEEFMEGEGNVIASQACRVMARGELTYGNCLFLNSGTGLGKSHLTQAVAHEVFRASPGTRLRYLTARQFSAEMVKDIQAGTMHDFKHRYLSCCDMLLVEDVHTLTGKAKTQEEFNEILDSLIKSGKKVILTASAPPAELEGIDSELRSRMTAGLVAAIEPPDLSTRMNIIRRKAANAGIFLDEDLVRAMAERLRGDVRKVESAVIGLAARSGMHGRAPDMAMLDEVVSSLGVATSRPDAEAIRALVAECFKVSVEELCSRSRRRAVTFPRQVGMYLARRYTDESLAAIGRIYQRDHSTVIHAVRAIDRAVTRDASVRGQVEMLARRLGTA